MVAVPTRCVVLLVLMSGCIHTTQFAFDHTEPVAVRAATEEAAAKLGWTLSAAESGRFTLIDAPRGPVDVEVSEGKLTLSGERQSMAVAPLFAALTRQELLHTEGEVLTARSTALTLALDALLPTAGLLYLGANDVTVPALSGNAFGLELAVRIVFDLLAAEMFVLSSLIPASVASPALFVGYGIGLLVINRVVAMVTDFRSLALRNSLAVRRSPMPSAEAVWRERTNSVR